MEKSDNPFALVVLAAKKSLESKGNEEKRFRFKRELVRLMLEKGYSREEILAVFRFLDGILALTDLEKERIIYDEFRSQEVEKVAYIRTLRDWLYHSWFWRNCRKSSAWFQKKSGVGFRR